MLINSSFVDCYDYHAKIYGVDKHIVYNRMPLTEANKESGFHPVLEAKTDTEVGVFYSSYGGRIKTFYDDYEFKTIIIGGKRITCYHLRDHLVKDPWRPVDADFIEKYNKFHSTVYLRRFKPGFHDLDIKDENIRLMREVGTPVFAINYMTADFNSRKKVYVIDGLIPKLSDYGITEVIPPNVLYQDISYALSNLMNQNPDNSPPTQMSDKEKVLAHGFDTKQSFRHRK